MLAKCPINRTSLVILALCVPVSPQAQTTAAKATPAQPTSGQQPTRAEVEQLKKKIDDLQAQIYRLQEHLQDTVKYVDGLTVVFAQKRTNAILDTSSPDKYERLETDGGSFLISLGKVESYLDGYRVELQIGNLMAATFKGFKVTAAWAKGGKAKTFSFTQDLLSGRWNSVQLILPETKPEDVGKLSIFLETNVISLGNPLSR